MSKTEKLLFWLLNYSSKPYKALLVLLVGLLTALISIELLLEFVEEIWFGSLISAVDFQIFTWIQQLRATELDPFFVRVTQLGDAQSLLILVTLCSVILIFSKRIFDMLVLNGCFIGTTLSMLLMKWILFRQRPEPITLALPAADPSFPSGHASMSLFAYAFVAYLIASQIKNSSQRCFILAIGVVIALLVGFSRLYLGVHWLSDILAGYALGATWLAVAITAMEMNRLKRTYGTFKSF